MGHSKDLIGYLKYVLQRKEAYRPNISDMINRFKVLKQKIHHEYMRKERKKQQEEEKRKKAEEEKRLEEEKKLAEEKRLAEERRLAEEKVGAPLLSPSSEAVEKMTADEKRRAAMDLYAAKKKEAEAMRSNPPPFPPPALPGAAGDFPPSPLRRQDAGLTLSQPHGHGTKAAQLAPPEFKMDLSASAPARKQEEPVPTPILTVELTVRPCPFPILPVSMQSSLLVVVPPTLLPSLPPTPPLRPHLLPPKLLPPGGLSPLGIARPFSPQSPWVMMPRPHPTANLRRPRPASSPPRKTRTASGSQLPASSSTASPTLTPRRRRRRLTNLFWWRPKPSEPFLFDPLLTFPLP